MKESEQRLLNSNLTSRREVRDILRTRGLRLKKSLGQNFLVDGNILKKILEEVDLKKNDLVIEIGAGIGTLTCQIAPKVKKVWAIEIDRGLVGVLREKLENFSNVEIIHGDALKIDFQKLILEEFGKFTPTLSERIKILGNIPYSLTSPLISKFLEEELGFRTAWLLLPEDVTRRMKAHPGTKAYGAFSIFVSFYAALSLVRKVSPQAFFPIPKVSSRLVKLERYQEERFKVKDKELFFQIVRESFKKRRKKLSNSLKPVFEKRGLASNIKEKTTIDLNRRGETLSLDEFAALSNSLS